VEVLTTREESGASGGSGTGEPAILTLLERRPCTAADVAEGLGIHLNEALKALDHLAVAGTVKTVASADRTFYIVTKRGANAGSPEGGPGR
jgi:predicted ArsR family transcriptional regulator